MHTLHTGLQITFRGIPPSETLRDVVQQKLEKMAFLLDSTTSCRVVFERQNGQRHGSTVSARIELHGTNHGSPVFVQACHPDAASAARTALHSVRSALDGRRTPARRGRG